MDSLDDGTCWDLFDYSFTNTPSTDFLWPNQSVMDIDFLGGGGGNDGNGEVDGDGALQEKEEKEYPRKRGRTDSCSKQGTKACREKLRRERLNDRFLDLSSVLEPGRPTKTDKPAILDDAVRVLNQLKSEAKELKETNEKLLEEIKSLKAEKNELREEKLVLKADKEKMEQQLKTMAMSPSGYMPAHPAAYQNKMAVFPGYSLVPMWNYLPPSTRDTSRDHELRPPAA
ncbi:Basic helix-loop-helix transcription factor [Trema orientale]|uniref:Basic helix-loop-helix transcription factor n=1 Tax=Trema orientale TaxID=63057 RepID=A0A2P5ECT2_TREOI|nr:Basic helix-loop-helix transcription factor [Trema orientale]